MSLFESTFFMGAVPMPMRKGKALFSLTVLAALAACGGGGGGDVASVPGSGGTGSYVAGPITGFGSVIINGVRYDDSAARIETEDGEGSDDDGKGTLDKGDLRLGMIAEVEGGQVTTGTNGALSTGTASVIRYINELKGPVSNVTGTGFTLLGQTVSVNPATIYENVSGIGAITGGNCAYAEVYAFYDATTSSYNATRVECKTTQPDSYRLYGPIGNLTGSTFTINGLTVTYTGVSELPTLSNGVVVRVRLSPASLIGNAATATRVKLNTKAARSSSKASVEGLITDYVATTDGATFKVNGVSVVLNASTDFEDGVQKADLSDGVRVEVEGALVDGVLTARSIEQESETDLEDQSEGQEFMGRASNVVTDDNGGTFTLTTSGGRVLTVTYLNTDFDNPSDQTGFGNNALVEVKGALGSDGASVDATKIQLED